jgi:membrane fusion protein, multidrug efflux system
MKLDMLKPKISSPRKLIGRIIFSIVVLGAVWTSYATFSRSSNLPRTTDASVDAEIVRISAGLPGRIARVAIRENDDVEEGQLLFTLDDTTYSLLRDQAAAQLTATRAVLADAIRTSRAGGENEKTAIVEIRRARSNLDLANSTVARLRPLAAEGIVSQQLLDEALVVVSGAKISLTVAQKTAKAAGYLINTTDVFQAEVLVAEAALALAEHNLTRTEVRAPFAGKVTGMNITEGAWVLPEMPVFTLIDTESWHVVGLFRETELAEISIGQAVRVRIRSNPDVVLDGHVESIGWGVLSSEEIKINGILPYVATSTNWVQLAKRFPVRVELADTSFDWLRIGASATLVLEPMDAKKTSND